jgi:hypothetical protein
MPARREPDELGTAALAAARAVARGHGLPTDDLIVMSSGANVVVRFAPTPVIAKAAASSRLVRDAGAFLARELAVAAAAHAAGLPAVAPADAVPAGVHEREGVPAPAAPATVRGSAPPTSASPPRSRLRPPASSRCTATRIRAT